MEITGIICEYNPFHSGHYKQLSIIRENNPNSAIVCLMSGNFVQRGMPSIFDMEIRAKAALICGADLVLELPVTAALSSAEGFASEGVRILNGFCDYLSFGAETPDIELLNKSAGALLSPDFSQHLKNHLLEGISFPAARQKALEDIGLDSSIVKTPNNILAIEYCKAILSQNAKIKPQPILRQGDFHAETPDFENPSATSLRLLLEKGKSCDNYVPQDIIDIYSNATIHAINNGERAILYRLRTMTDEEYSLLPYGSEGLWRKLMKNARTLSSLEEIINATKSKRYTRTRIDRMIMCAFLGLTQGDILSPAPYCRVLALNERGREILRRARTVGVFPNIGDRIEHPYQQIENRCDDLYGLFASDRSECSGTTIDRRIVYLKK